MLKKQCSGAFALLLSLAVSGGLAKADVLFTGDVSILSTDPTQMGRLSRNGIPQDWSFQEAFPGTINSTTSYHYETISVLVPNWLSFLQITIDSNNANIFASVYDTSYNPDSGAPNGGLDINYLGDAGASGNFFGTDPRFFQVVDQTAADSPTGFGTAIVVLNETVTNGGLNSPVNVLVEGFSDTSYDEISPVPEPVHSGLLLAGILAVAVACRRRRWLPSRD